MGHRGSSGLLGAGSWISSDRDFGFRGVWVSGLGVEGLRV